MNDVVELRYILTTVLRNWWILLLAAIAGAAIGYSVSKTQDPVYEATTTLMIGRSISDASLSRTDILLGQELAPTYMELARREPVLQGTIDTLQLDMDWSDLKSNVSAKLVDTTNLLEISVQAATTDEAIRIADEIAHQMTLIAANSQTEGDNGNGEFITQRLTYLRQNIEKGQKQLESLQSQLQKAPTASAEVLRDQINSLENSISDWDSSYSRLITYQNSATNNQQWNRLEIVEAASASSTPVKPQVRLITLAVALVLAGLATLLVFLRDYLDDTIRTPDDIFKYLGLKNLGELRKVKGKNLQGRLISHHDPLFEAADDYRLLRSRLQTLWANQERKVLMVTSPVQSQLSSLVVANLGIVLAQAGLKTIIVDANLRAPLQHEIFGVARQEGFTEFVNAPDSPTAKYLHGTGVVNLKVLTAGDNLTIYPSEFLTSTRISQVINRISEIADVILFDSSHTVGIADALVLSSHVDSVLLMLEPAKVHRKVAQQAVADLRQAGANVVGVVLSPITNRNVRNSPVLLPSSEASLATGTSKQ